MNFSTNNPSLKTLLAIVAIATSIFCHGQNTLQYVPADAPFVVAVNIGNLSKRVNLNQLKQYDFYNSMLRQMEQSEIEPGEEAYFRRFLDSPAELGFDMLRPFYFFIKEKGDTTFYNIVMEMGDRPLYENGLMELHPDSFSENLVEKPGYQIWQGEDETYVWNDEVILNIWSEYTPSFDDFYSDDGEWETEDDWSEEYEVPEGSPDAESVFESNDFEEVEEEELPIFESHDIEEDEEYAEIEEVKEEIFFEDTEFDTSYYDSEEEDWADEFDSWSADTRAATANWANELMTGQIGTPLSSNADFRNAKAQQADLHFWMDYSYFLNEYKSSQSMYGGMSEGKMAPFKEMAEGMVETLYGGTSLSWGLSFEQGKMAIRSQQFFNDEMQDFYQGVKDVKFNKKFFRYVEGGDELFGYAYFNFNIKNAIEEGKTLMHSILRSHPGAGQAASDAAQIIGIFIDEEAIGNVLRGDMMVSVSGMQTVMVSTTTYDWDEDFNYIATDTILEKTFPKFTALATFGSRKDIMKFINLGLHSEVLSKDGAFYKMTEPDSGVEFFLALQKNMLILTNNRALLASKMEKGIAKKNRLSKKHRKLLCDHSSVMYWDVPNTMQQVGGEGNSNIGPMYYVDVFGKQFESLAWKSSKQVKGSVDNEFDFNFKNKNTNSLEQFFIFINDIFVEFEGGAKI